ncbi:sec-independent translocase [Streptomyces sp. HNM0574]|uniref:sec-independent translocase n=1 Tax=Streptomyces sp. HNM0574 TaxID=2714954 RepID=UPI00146AD438|nr:Sec-independent protein translocase subunit TatB [Streptomyces sp. HNM0574]
MFFDIGPLELIALIILAVLIFGPDKLPKVIQDVSSFIRKVRAFSDNARDDIRSELGPEFKDFDFEDLNPKTFARKHLLEGDDMGMKDIRESFDLRNELNEVTDAVNGTESRSGTNGTNGSGTNGAISLNKDGGGRAAKNAPLAKGEPPPFDADAT